MYNEPYTPLLYTQSVTMKDTNYLYLLNSNAQVMEYIKEVEDYATATSVTNYMAYCNQRNPVLQHWLVKEQITDDFVGWFALQPSDNKEYIEIAYRFLPAYWNKGYATDIGKQVLHYAFLQKIQKITAITDKNNLASIKVLLKLGFLLLPNPNYAHLPVNYFEICY